MNKLSRFLAPLTVVSVTLAGCGESQPQVIADNAVEPVVTKVSSKVLDDVIGKPTVPVAVEYSFAGTPAVGVPLEVSVTISSVDMSSLGMTMSTRGQLDLGKTMPDQIALKTGLVSAETNTVDVVVIPSATGRSYLNLQVSGMYEGQPFTKAMSLPVQVGEGGPELATNGEIIDTGVEVLSSMPAEQQVEPAEDASR
ncbi:MAG: hypothetical protein AAF270_14035 [Pseudomonadota bacterium]